MSERLRFGLALAVLSLVVGGVFCGGGALVYSAIDPPARSAVLDALADRLGLVVVLAAITPLCLALLLRSVFERYVWVPRRLVQEAELMLTANPAHRVSFPATDVAGGLGTVVNRFADRVQELQADVEARIADGRADLEEERNRLAALMSQLTMSVLVCNIEGSILLYNPRAKELLARPSGEPGTARPLVGLGRSVFGILDRGVVLHALGNLHHQSLAGEESLVSQFVTSTKAGYLIRVQMAPVLDSRRELTGFVLTLDDITRALKMDQERGLLFQSFTEHTRSALGNIRAAIENLIDYAHMDPRRQVRFLDIIRDEAVALSRELDETTTELTACGKTLWPLEDVRGSDLLSSIQRRLENRVHLRVRNGGADPTLWLKVDSFNVSQAVTYLAVRLREELGIEEVSLTLGRSDRMAHIDLSWSGAPLLQLESVLAWENEPMNTADVACALTLKELAERHGGEVWYHGDRLTRHAYIRLLLPVSEPGEALTVRPLAESRPVYYDFDLFSQFGQDHELDERRLTDLTYTVFDTETTGLEPSRGDEILSIGAVRIVNNRLLQSEVFDQLVDPRRPISPLSTSIHGITAAMVRGQPTIDVVLPQFHLFAEDTVLVAHNAAFDLRFLQLKESEAGVVFVNPVLDTLLLSVVLHPRDEAHELEAIADLLGVNLIGRHTSLGDAIVTGEIFLKMIPLLEAKGIQTLKDAREACEKTLAARQKY